MATPDLIQLNPTAGTLGTSNLTMGFPVSPATFRYALFSFWVCLGQDGIARSITWEAEYNFFYMFLDTGAGNIRIRFTAGLSNFWWDAHYNHTFPGPITNLQISVDGVAGIVQVYANDAPLAVSTGGRTAVPLGPFEQTTFWATYGLSGGSSAPGNGPGIGDIFMAAPASFFDLTVTANRRKFQNANLSPVDLGTNASSVLGTPPPIYLTARGGNASNFAVNNGTGGSFAFNAGFTPTMLAPGTCSIPWPTVAPKLAMDDVVVTATAILDTVHLISLRWSDDRGHSFGSWVTQPIGEAGEYRTSLQWQRLAYARDRVFELSWSVPMRTALQGAWIDVTPAQS